MSYKHHKLIPTKFRILKFDYGHNPNPARAGVFWFVLPPPKPTDEGKAYRTRAEARAVVKAAKGRMWKFCPGDPVGLAVETLRARRSGNHAIRI